MRVKQIENGYFLIFEKGDKIIQTFQDFVIEKNITAGSFSGIGAFLYADLGHFNINTEKYDVHRIEKDLEVLNLSGNITLKDGKPFVHMHALVSAKDMIAKGGHVMEAEVSLTIEMYVKVHNLELEREFDKETGLFLIK